MLIALGKSTIKNRAIIACLNDTDYKGVSNLSFLYLQLVKIFLRIEEERK